VLPHRPSSVLGSIAWAYTEQSARDEYVGSNREQQDLLPY